MKDWQKGYLLEYLLELEDFYSRYNTHSCSPFSAMKKNTIASGLYGNTLKIYEHDEKRIVMVDTKIARTRSAITMYGNVKIGVKEKGDRVITKLAWKEGHEKTATEVIESFTEPCWLYIWAEDKEANDIAKKAGFEWVGTKVTTFGELYAVYYKDARNMLFNEPRQHPTRLKVEDCSLERVDIDPAELYTSIQPLIDAIKDFDEEYTNHYSNYNKGKSWSALSLRGYSPDPAFITKPVEMSKKWQLEHIKEDFVMQDTELRMRLPQVEYPLETVNLFGSNLHRIRLMRLAPNGGELERHTDQVDPDTGVKNGNVMRFHFPLITNEDVLFTIWQVDGTKKTIHMREGECWYLDTRKPHSAVNNGTTDRIHLVVDVEANDKIRELIDGTSNRVF